MELKTFTKCACLFLLSTNTFGQQYATIENELPNIVLILADDLGWSDLGCYGSKYYETPNIDKLAEDGIRFTDAYSAAPVCAPTRASLMTGKTPAQLHLTAVFDRDYGKMPLIPPDWTKQLALEETTIAERLKEKGYTTAIMGKWHIGQSEEMWPENQGFDINFAAWSSGKPKSYFPPYENPKISDEKEGEYLTDRIAREAVGFINANANKEKPFFLYLPFYCPHLPISAPEKTIEYFKNKTTYNEQNNPVYAAMIYHLDMAVGEVIKALDKNNLNKNTIVIFTSDNGGVYSIFDIHVTDNSPLRAEKFLLYEGGIRVPLIVKWPKEIPNGETTSQLAITHDLVPTIMCAVGDPVFDNDIEGINLMPVLKSGDKAKFSRMLTWHYPHYMPSQNMKPSSAIRIRNMKLIHWHENHKLELFDLSEDLSETNNIIQSRPDIARELYKHLDEWRTLRGVQMPIPNPEYSNQ